MKALEKAAKDRDDARAEPATAAPAAAAMPSAAPKSELTLEPLAPAAPAPEAPARPSAAASRASARASREQVQAAEVLEAGRSSRGPAVAGFRPSPVVWFGIVAALFAIGFGTYVYLQVYHPSLFFRTPAKAPASPISTAPTTGTVPGTVPAPAPAPVPAVPPRPVATAPEAQEILPEPAAAPAPPVPAPPAPARSAPASPPSAPAEPPPAAKTAATPPRSTISVSPGSSAPVVPPLLNEAYSALQAGQLEPAQRAYERLLRSDPRNIDALHGMAAIATLEGKNDEAIRRYLQVLEVEPRNALAQSGLIGLLGRADPLAAESRLKQLIAREPSAFLYFTLGNLYADQLKWAAAQQAFFQAHHLEPSNPDYAYNLAVGLEHLSQTRLALGFYRRAVQLAGGAARSHFNVALAQDRISKLASQVE